MKTAKVVFAFLAFLMAFQLHLNAQDGNDRTYFLIDYMKVKPGKYSDYVRLERSVWKKIHQERIKQGKITGWWFYEVRYPSGTSAEYDFVTVSRVQGWNGIDSFYTGWGNAYRTLSKAESATADSTEMFRDLLRTDVVGYGDGVFRDDFEKNPPAYLLVNYMDVPDGKWEEYRNLEINVVKPMHANDVKDGKRAGWGLYGVIFPYGSEQQYDAITVDCFDKWEDIWSGDAEESLKKVHPGMSMEYFSRQIDSARKHLRGDVWVLRDQVIK